MLGERDVALRATACMICSSQRAGGSRHRPCAASESEGESFSAGSSHDASRSGSGWPGGSWPLMAFDSRSVAPDGRLGRESRGPRRPNRCADGSESPRGRAGPEEFAFHVVGTRWAGSSATIRRVVTAIGRVGPARILHETPAGNAGRDVLRPGMGRGLQVHHGQFIACHAAEFSPTNSVPIPVRLGLRSWPSRPARASRK
jgi:hypothetical protein